jgi:hypothetical protein
VIDGPDGEALRRRQIAAICRALAWLAAHVNDGEEKRS